ncbi:hypothetical protein LOK49_LG11G02167 [Camellia lanceoleosa]|uniref:Uncharacterized protein n=1 Tax=Camellia lanceoleosa TaxID=1840588 RepID=A0ACC0FXK7_9ERIC|nr:hypothetical protein LOK49_LG11G02167 [Camellia lanceoleosa]
MFALPVCVPWQLKGWYNKDDVVAEWKEVKEDMYLDVHCYVSGPNLLLDLAAKFRYHIFSKELPLLNSSLSWHGSLKKYNRVECGGPLKDAAQEDEEIKSAVC